MTNIEDKVKEKAKDTLADKKTDEFTDIQEMIRKKTVAQYYVRSKLDRKVLIMQLAEESAELSQACLKYLRSIEETNLCEKQDMSSIIEEYSDVINVVETAWIHPDYEIITRKAERWANRLQALEERKGTDYE